MNLDIYPPKCHNISTKQILSTSLAMEVYGQDVCQDFRVCRITDGDLQPHFPTRAKQVISSLGPESRSESEAGGDGGPEEWLVLERATDADAHFVDGS